MGLHDSQRKFTYREDLALKDVKTSLEAIKRKQASRAAENASKIVEAQQKLHASKATSWNPP